MLENLLSSNVSLIIAAISAIVSIISFIMSLRSYRENEKNKRKSISINYVDKNDRKKELKMNIDDGKNKVDVADLLGEITVTPSNKEGDKQ